MQNQMKSQPPLFALVVNAELKMQENAEEIM